MAASVLGTVSFTNPNDNPDGSVLLPIYWWNPATKSYTYYTTIEAGEGYWIVTLRDAPKDGVMSLSSSMSPMNSPQPN